MSRPTSRSSAATTKARRRSLGYALHTLQGFYAHSNWIELGNTGAGFEAAATCAAAATPRSLGPGGGELVEIAGAGLRQPAVEVAPRAHHHLSSAAA